MLYLIDQFQVTQLCLKRLGKTCEIKLFYTVICHFLMHGLDNQWQKSETTKYRKPYKSIKWHTVD